MKLPMLCFVAKDDGSSGDHDDDDDGDYFYFCIAS